MKNFYVSLSVFCVLLVLIFGNARVIEHRAAALEVCLTAPDAAEEAALRETLARWEKLRTWVDISVPYEDIRALDTQLCTMQTAARLGEFTDFEIARQTALRALDRIRQLERPSLENIF